MNEPFGSFTKLDLCFQVFFTIKFLKLEIDTALIIKPVHQGAVIGPKGLHVRRGNRADTFPFLLEVLELLKGVLGVLAINEGSQLMKYLFFLIEVGRFLFLQGSVK